MICTVKRLRQVPVKHYLNKTLILTASNQVSILKDILQNKFHFETDYFEIPSEKCQTSLQKKLSEFCLENDDPDCLAILYYAGHGYLGKDTSQYKLAA